MAFQDVRFPTNALIGVRWEPDWEDTVVFAGGGDRFHNEDWQHPLWRATVDFIRAQDDTLATATVQAIRELLAFWLGVRHRRHTFRAKCHPDFIVPRQSFALGTGAAQTYQLTNTYSLAPLTYVRDVKLPVDNGSAMFWHDGTPEVEGAGGFSINYLTGELTTDAALGDLTGQTLEWSGQQDIPMAVELGPNLQSITPDHWQNIGMVLMETRYP